MQILYYGSWHFVFWCMGNYVTSRMIYRCQWKYTSCYEYAIGYHCVHLEIFPSGTKIGPGLSCRDQSRYAPSQWETSLQCNDVSHWLGAHLNWSLSCSKSKSQYHPHPGNKDTRRSRRFPIQNCGMVKGHEPIHNDIICPFPWKTRQHSTQSVGNMPPPSPPHLLPQVLQIMPRNPKYDQFQPKGHHNEENPQSTTKMPGNPKFYLFH